MMAVPTGKERQWLSHHLSSENFQVVSRKGDIVGRGYINKLQLESDVTKPVVSIKGLS